MTVKKVLITCAAVLIISVVLEIAFVTHKTYYWWHEVTGFSLIYGLVGCAVLIVAAKLLGKLIQRKENYYDGGEDGDV